MSGILPFVELALGLTEWGAAGHNASEGHNAEAAVGMFGGLGSLANGAAGLLGVAHGHGLLGLGGAHAAETAGLSAGAGAGVAAATGGLIGGAGGVALGSGMGHMAGAFFDGHVPEGVQSGLTWGGGAAGLVAGAACPALAPFIAGAGLVSHLGGLASHHLEEHGHTTAAEGVSTLGMAGSGALLGAGIGSVVPALGTAVGAGIGGGIGGLVGGAMGIFGDDAAGPNEGVGVDGHRVTEEEGMGMLGMAGGGALLGAGIGSIVPAVGTAIGAAAGGLIGGAAGLIGSLWD